MWRYMKNVEPPVKKLKTKSEHHEVQRKYEAETRKRNFQEGWMKGRPWLLKPEDGKGMRCAVCLEGSKTNTKVAVKNVFIGEGCNSGRLESINIHQKSNSHVLAQHIVDAKDAPNNTPIVTTIRKMNVQDTERIARLFRNVHALAKHNRPYSDIKWMNQLDRAKGMDVQARYDNEKYAKTFAHYIATNQRDVLLEECKRSSFFCLLSDGSTDYGVMEQEMVFLRFVVDGVVKVRFIGVSAVEKANAAGIFAALKKNASSLFAWNEFGQKLVALGCDGAAVMVGKKSGVAALLKQVQPSLVVVHCFAHKLELALKDAVKKNKLYEKVVRVLLMGLFYFYHNSPLNRSMLKRSLELQGGKKLMPTRVGGTRWISHTVRAIGNFLETMVAIKQHLEQVTNTHGAEGSTSATTFSKARCFLPLMMVKSTFLELHFLLDALEELSRLSTAFQATDASAVIIHRSLKRTLAVLKKFQTSDGPHLRKARDVEEVDGRRLTGNAVAFEASRRQFLQRLIECLEQRFENTDEGVLRATRVIDFAAWPHSDDSTDFGDDDIQLVVAHYNAVLIHAGVDPVLAEVEWTALKTRLYDEMSLNAIHKLTLTKINHLRSEFGNILSVLSLLATIPASSAEVERGFSQLKLVKTSLRTTLSGQHLNELLTIKMLSPDVDLYDPTEAMQKWITGGQRVRRFHDKSIRMRPVVVEDGHGEPVVVEGGHGVPSDDPKEMDAAVVADGEPEAEEIGAAAAEDIEDTSSDEDSGFEYSDDSDMEEDKIDALLKSYEF